jgi:hypothetical protein
MSSKGVSILLYLAKPPVAAVDLQHKRKS